MALHLARNGVDMGVLTFFTDFLRLFTLTPLFFPKNGIPDAQRPGVKTVLPDTHDYAAL